MIVLRRPLTLYDLDVMGVGACLALGGLGLWLAFGGWPRAWHRYQALAQEHAVTANALRQSQQAYTEFQRDLEHLEHLVAQHTANAPHVQARADLLRDLTELALRYQVELRTVIPRALEPGDRCQLGDVELGGRGRLSAIIGFLGELGRRHPYQALQTCRISSGTEADRGICEVTCTLRFHLLDDETTAVASEGR